MLSCRKDRKSLLIRHRAAHVQVCVCVCVCVLYVCFRKDIVIRSLEWREGVSGVPNRHTSRKKHRQKLTHYTHTLSLAHTHTHTPVRSQVWGMVRDVSAVPPSSSIMTGEWWEGPCEEVVQKNMHGWTNQGTPAEPKLFTHTRTHTPTWYSMYPHTAEPQTVSEVLQLIMHESVCGAGGGPVSRTAGPNEVGHVCLTPLPGSHE